MSVAVRKTMRVSGLRRVSARRFKARGTAHTNPVLSHSPKISQRHGRMRTTRRRCRVLRMTQVASAWVSMTKKGTGRCLTVFLFTTHIALARNMYAAHTAVSRGASMPSIGRNPNPPVYQIATRPRRPLGKRGRGTAVGDTSGTPRAMSTPTDRQTRRGSLVETRARVCQPARGLRPRVVILKIDARRALLPGPASRASIRREPFHRDTALVRAPQRSTAGRRHAAVRVLRSRRRALCVPPRPERDGRGSPPPRIRRRRASRPRGRASRVRDDADASPPSPPPPPPRGGARRPRVPPPRPRGPRPLRRIQPSPRGRARVGGGGGRRRPRRSSSPPGSRPPRTTLLESRPRGDLRGKHPRQDHARRRRRGRRRGDPSPTPTRRTPGPVRFSPTHAHPRRRRRRVRRRRERAPRSGRRPERPRRRRTNATPPRQSGQLRRRRRTRNARRLSRSFPKVDRNIERTFDVPVARAVAAAAAPAPRVAASANGRHRAAGRGRRESRREGRRGKDADTPRGASGTLHRRARASRRRRGSRRERREGKATRGRVQSVRLRRDGAHALEVRQMARDT